VKPIRVECAPTERRADNVLHHLEQFKVFNEMYRVRDFRLVLCADVLDCIVESAMQELDRIVKAERMNGGLYYLLREPLIVSEMRSPLTRLGDPHVGSTAEFSAYGSAL